MGSKKSDFGVIPVRPAQVRIKGNLMGTIMDNKPFVNIRPFGQCKSPANPIVAAATAANYGKLQPMPCAPATATPWIGGKTRVCICGEPTILDNSKLTCAWLGIIEVTNAGQNFVSEDYKTPIDAQIDTVDTEGKTADVIAETGEVVPWEDVERLTVKDIAEILKKIEDKQGYEAARYYATNCIDYWKVNLLAKRYVDEEDEDKKEKEKNNDPNLMPSRYMLLYGADDEGLQGQENLDDYHDKFDDEEDIKISVANLRKGLQALDFKIEEDGPFDDKVYHAFLQFHWNKGRIRLAGVYAEEDDSGKSFDAVAEKYGMFTWKTIQDEYNGTVDHKRIQEDLNTEYGDELLKEKGADPTMFRPGVAYHYLWVPFLVTPESVVMFAQAGGTSGDMKSDASMDPYKRKSYQSLSGESSAKPEPQKPKKIVVLMAFWYNMYKLQNMTGFVDLKDTTNVFTKTIYDGKKELEDTFKKMDIELEIIQEQFDAGEQTNLLYFITAKDADVITITGHSFKGINFLMDVLNIDSGNKPNMLELYQVNQWLKFYGNNRHAVIDACGLRDTLENYSNLDKLADKFYIDAELEVKGSAGVFDYIERTASDIAEKKWGIKKQ